MRSINYSKKKIVRRFYNKSLQEHILNRKQFGQTIKNINKDDIICIDESGITRETYSKHGWTVKGKRLQCNISIKDLPNRYSLLMAINKDEVLYHETHKNKAINTDLFESFLEVLCSLHTGKYILMDNVA